MKKLNYLCLFVFILSLTACSSDDDNSSTSGDIGGEWKITNMEFEGSSSSEIQGQTITTNYNGHAIDLDDNDKVNFHDNNSYTSSTDGFTMKYTVETMGQEISQETEIDDVFSEGTYAKDGNTLTLTDDSGESTAYQIETLSDSTLKLKSNQLDAFDMGPLGADGDIEVRITMKR